jgi:hypothetical protein
VLFREKGKVDKHCIIIHHDNERVSSSITKGAARDNDLDLQHLIAKPNPYGARSSNHPPWNSLKIKIQGPTLSIAPCPLGPKSCLSILTVRQYVTIFLLALAVFQLELMFEIALQYRTANDVIVKVGVASLRGDITDDVINILGVSSNLSKWLSLVKDARDAFGARQCDRGKRNHSRLYPTWAQKSTANHSQV